MASGPTATLPGWVFSLMTNEQLSVLLTHIALQIDQATGELEHEFHAFGMGTEQVQGKILRLRSIADMLLKQSVELRIKLP